MQARTDKHTHITHVHVSTGAHARTHGMLVGAALLPRTDRVPDRTYVYTHVHAHGLHSSLHTCRFPEWPSLWMTRLSTTSSSMVCMAAHATHTHARIRVPECAQYVLRISSVGPALHMFAQVSRRISMHTSMHMGVPQV